MKQEQIAYERCELCKPRSRQQKLINKMLLRQLLKVKQVKPSFWLDFPPDSNRQPLQALHKVLGHLSSTKNDKGDHQCTHGMWLRSIQKTGYNLAQVSSLCDYMLSRQAERAYQLWLLQSQIKNIAENICSSHGTPSAAKVEEGIFPIKLQHDDTRLKMESQAENPSQPCELKHAGVDGVVKSEEAYAEHEAMERSSPMTNYCLPWPHQGHPFPGFFAAPFM